MNLIMEDQYSLFDEESINEMLSWEVVLRNSWPRIPQYFIDEATRDFGRELRNK